MKFIAGAITLASLVGAVTAFPSRRLHDAAATCPNVTSCTSAAQGVSSCCTPTYGVMVLVQQWVVGYGPSNAFTLHGFWPDTCSGGEGPSSGCDSSRSYSGIASILQSNAPSTYDEANTYWPSDSGPNDSFWTHEWDKHGTCVSTLNPSCFSNPSQYEDVTTYFQTVLDLRAEYDLYQALQSGNISPGGSVSTSSFSSAIQQAFSVQPEINCESGALSEVWLYFNVQGPSTYVPIDATSSGSCSGSFSFPSKGTAPVSSSSQTTSDSTGTTTSTTSTSPSSTSLGSCSWDGDQYCLSSSSAQYKECVNGNYVLENCPSSTACNQDQKYNISCD